MQSCEHIGVAHRRNHRAKQPSAPRPTGYTIWWTKKEPQRYNISSWRILRNITSSSTHNIRPPSRLVLLLIVWCLTRSSARGSIRNENVYIRVAVPTDGNIIVSLPDDDDRPTLCLIGQSAADFPAQWKCRRNKLLLDGLGLLPSARSRQEESSNQEAMTLVDCYSSQFLSLSLSLGLNQYRRWHPI